MAVVEDEMSAGTLVEGVLVIAASVIRWKVLVGPAASAAKDVIQPNATVQFSRKVATMSVCW